MSRLCASKSEPVHYVQVLESDTLVIPGEGGVLHVVKQPTTQTIAPTQDLLTYESGSTENSLGESSAPEHEDVVGKGAQNNIALGSESDPESDVQTSRASNAGIDQNKHWFPEMSDSAEILSSAQPSPYDARRSLSPLENNLMLAGMSDSTDTLSSVQLSLAKNLSAVMNSPTLSPNMHRPDTEGFSSYSTNPPLSPNVSNYNLAASAAAIFRSLIPNSAASTKPALLQSSEAAVDFTQLERIFGFGNLEILDENTVRLFRADPTAISQRYMIDGDSGSVIAETLSMLWRNMPHKTKPSILECTACCGGSVLQFISSGLFAKVDAIEKNHQRCSYLEHNYNMLKTILESEDKNITDLKIFHGDFAKVVFEKSGRYHDEKPDIIFYDPVWWDMFAEDVLPQLEIVKDKNKSKDSDLIMEIEKWLEHITQEKRDFIFTVKCPKASFVIDDIIEKFQTQYMLVYQSLQKMTLVYIMRLDPEKKSSLKFEGESRNNLNETIWKPVSSYRPADREELFFEGLWDEETESYPKDKIFNERNQLTDEAKKLVNMHDNYPNKFIFVENQAWRPQSNVETFALYLAKCDTSEKKLQLFKQISKDEQPAVLRVKNKRAKFGFILHQTNKVFDWWQDAYPGITNKQKMQVKMDLETINGSGTDLILKNYADVLGRLSELIENQQSQEAKILWSLVYAIITMSSRDDQGRALNQLKSLLKYNFIKKNQGSFYYTPEAHHNLHVHYDVTDSIMYPSKSRNPDAKNSKLSGIDYIDYLDQIGKDMPPGYFYQAPFMEERDINSHHGQCKLAHTHCRFLFDHVYASYFKPNQSLSEFYNQTSHLKLVYIGAANTKKPNGEVWTLFKNTEELRPDLEINDEDFKIAMEMNNDEKKSEPQQKILLKPKPWYQPFENFKIFYVQSDEHPQEWIKTDSVIKFPMGKQREMQYFFAWNFKKLTLKHSAFFTTKCWFFLPIQEGDGVYFKCFANSKKRNKSEWIWQEKSDKLKEEDKVHWKQKDLDKIFNLVFPPKFDTQVKLNCIDNNFETGQWIKPYDDVSHFYIHRGHDMWELAREENIRSLQPKDKISQDKATQYLFRAFKKYKPFSKQKKTLYFQGNLLRTKFQQVAKKIQEGSWVYVFNQRYVVSGTRSERYLADFLRLFPQGDILLIDPQAIDETKLRQDLGMNMADPRLEVQAQSFTTNMCIRMAEGFRTLGTFWQECKKEANTNNLNSEQVATLQKHLVLTQRFSIEQWLQFGIRVNKDTVVQVEASRSTWEVCNEMPETPHQMPIENTEVLQSLFCICEDVVVLDLEQQAELKIANTSNVYRGFDEKFENHNRVSISNICWNVRINSKGHLVFKKIGNNLAATPLTDLSLTPENKKKFQSYFLRPQKNIVLTDQHLEALGWTDISIQDNSILEMYGYQWQPKYKKRCLCPVRQIPVLISDARKDTLIRNSSVETATCHALANILQENYLQSPQNDEIVQDNMAMQEVTNLDVHVSFPNRTTIYDEPRKKLLTWFQIQQKWKEFELWNCDCVVGPIDGKYWKQDNTAWVESEKEHGANCEPRNMIKKIIGPINAKFYEYTSSSNFDKNDVWKKIKINTKIQTAFEENKYSLENFIPDIDGLTVGPIQGYWMTYNAQQNKWTAHDEEKKDRQHQIIVQESDEDLIKQQLRTKLETQKIEAHVANMTNKEANRDISWHSLERSLKKNVLSAAVKAEETVSSYVNNTLWLLILAGFFHGDVKTRCFANIKTSLTAFAPVASQLPLLFQDRTTGQDFVNDMLSKLMISEFLQGTQEGFGNRPSAMESRHYVALNSRMRASKSSGFLNPLGAGLDERIQAVNQKITEYLYCQSIFFDEDMIKIPTGGSLKFARFGTGGNPRDMTDVSEQFGEAHKELKDDGQTLFVTLNDNVSIPKNVTPGAQKLCYIMFDNVYYILETTHVCYEAFDFEKMSHSLGSIRLGTNNLLFVPNNFDSLMKRDFAHKLMWSRGAVPWVAHHNKTRSSESEKRIAEQITNMLQKSLATVTMDVLVQAHKSKPTLPRNEQKLEAVAIFDRILRIWRTQPRLKLWDCIDRGLASLSDKQIQNVKDYRIPSWEQALEKCCNAYEKQQKSNIRWRDRLVGPFWLLGYIEPEGMQPLLELLHYSWVQQIDSSSISFDLVLAEKGDDDKKEAIAAIIQTLQYATEALPMRLELITALQKIIPVDSAFQIKANTIPQNYRLYVQDHGASQGTRSFMRTVEKHLAIRFYNFITIPKANDSEVQDSLKLGSLLRFTREQRMKRKLPVIDRNRWNLFDLNRVMLFSRYSIHEWPSGRIGRSKLAELAQDNVLDTGADEDEAVQTSKSGQKFTILHRILEFDLYKIFKVICLSTGFGYKLEGSDRAVQFYYDYSTIDQKKQAWAQCSRLIMDFSARQCAETLVRCFLRMYYSTPELFDMISWIRENAKLSERPSEVRMDYSSKLVADFEAQGFYQELIGDRKQRTSEFYGETYFASLCSDETKRPVVFQHGDKNSDWFRTKINLLFFHDNDNLAQIDVLFFIFEMKRKILDGFYRAHMKWTKQRQHEKVKLDQWFKLNLSVDTGRTRQVIEEVKESDWAKSKFLRYDFKQGFEVLKNYMEQEEDNQRNIHVLIVFEAFADCLSLQDTIKRFIAQNPEVKLELKKLSGDDKDEDVAGNEDRGYGDDDDGDDDDDDNGNDEDGDGNEDRGYGDADDRDDRSDEDSAGHDDGDDDDDDDSNNENGWVEVVNKKKTNHANHTRA